MILIHIILVCIRILYTSYLNLYSITIYNKIIIVRSPVQAKAIHQTHASPKVCVNHLCQPSNHFTGLYKAATNQYSAAARKYRGPPKTKPESGPSWMSVPMELQGGVHPHTHLKPKFFTHHTKPLLYE